MLQLPQAQTARKCRLEEKSRRRDHQQRYRPALQFERPCIERGTTIAYNAEATDAARKDVVEISQQTFQ